MKKLMLVMGLLSMVVFTHAAEQKESKPEVNIEQNLSVLTDDEKPVRASAGSDFECTMSASFTVTIGVAKFEVSCTAKGSTCDIALATAEGCVMAGVRRIRAAIK
jgi:hypothetical protein